MEITADNYCTLSLMEINQRLRTLIIDHDYQYVDNLAGWIYFAIKAKKRPIPNRPDYHAFLRLMILARKRLPTDDDWYDDDEDDDWYDDDWYYDDDDDNDEGGDD